MPVRDLPARPDLRQLKHQAKDLLRDIRGADPAAIADFREYHPALTDPAEVKLADAQLVLARTYHASSWPRLVAACEVIDAIWRDDMNTARELLLAHAELARDYPSTRGRGWGPAISQAANHGVRRVVTMLQERGARRVAEALARPELRPFIDTLRLLSGVGGRPPKDAVGGAVETLQGDDFAFMLELDADVSADEGRWRSLVALTLETYSRYPEGKHRILEAMAGRGIPLPDTAPMAVHRGRLDLLEQHLRRDKSLLQRTFSHQEIFPPELGCHADEWLALVGAPLGGATLLHIAADYEELETAQWLLDRGMDPNVRAVVDSSGFGGHTALFNCVVTYNAGRRDDRLAACLLDRGGDPNVRASIRKKLPFASDKSIHEYRDVTPLGWGRRFHDPTYVSQPAMQLIARRGGLE
jgi:hypothetical protein